MELRKWSLAADLKWSLAARTSGLETLAAETSKIKTSAAETFQMGRNFENGDSNCWDFADEGLPPIQMEPTGSQNLENGTLAAETFEMQPLASEAFQMNPWPPKPFKMKHMATKH